MKRTLIAVFFMILWVMCGCGAALNYMPPSVVTNKATEVTATSAVLNAEVNPNGSQTEVWFEYGTTVSLGTEIFRHNAGAGREAFITGCSVTVHSNTTYYFRGAAQNSNGTTYGRILSFTTLLAREKQLAAIAILSPDGSPIPTGPNNYVIKYLVSNIEQLTDPRVRFDIIQNENVLGYRCSSPFPNGPCPLNKDPQYWNFSWEVGSYTLLSGSGYQKAGPGDNYQIRAMLFDGNVLVSQNTSQLFSIIIAAAPTAEELRAQIIILNAQIAALQHPPSPDEQVQVTAPTDEEIQAQIDALLKQISDLQAQLADQK